jgi:hypothetical protein
MLVTEKFVFIHLHKCGGTFINDAVVHCVPHEQVGYHLPYKFVPAEFKHLPVLGSVRNPWDFYVSLFHFQGLSKKPNMVFKAFSDDGELSFEDTIYNMTNPTDVHFDRLYAMAPDDFINAGVNLTKNCIEWMRGMEGGWLTRMYTRLYEGADTQLTVIKMENLRTQFLDYLRSHEYQITRKVKDHVLKSKKKNVSKRDSYPGYYSDALQTSVAKADAGIIDQYGYTFGE